MADEIILKNDLLTVAISITGAEIQSVQSSKGTEFIWYGDEKVWAGRTPLLFPICGGLKDDKYVFKGSEYALKKHGYARFSEFAVESQTETQVVLTHCSSAQTRKQYPFDYKLSVIYRLTENSVEVIYRVENSGDKTLYFSIGAHEGYLCPEGIEAYDIVFPQDETLDSYILNGNLLENKTVRVLENSRILPLKYDYFAVDALVFKRINSKRVTLRQRNGDRQVDVSFDGFPYLLLWTKPGAPYICIEPWCGIQDSMDSDYDFVTKEGIHALPAGKLFDRTHNITFKD